MKFLQSKMMPLLVAVGLTVTCTHAVAASPKLDKCLNKAGGFTVAMAACLDEETNALDKELNANYKNLMVELDPSRKPALLKAQRAWLVFRKANCDFYYDPNGGSMASIMAMECGVDALAARNEELKNLIKITY